MGVMITVAFVVMVIYLVRAKLLQSAHQICSLLNLEETS